MAPAGERTKTNVAIDILLVHQTVDCLRDLILLVADSDWLLPAQKVQDRMLPHIHEITLNVALAKVKPLIKGFEKFELDAELFHTVADAQPSANAGGGMYNEQRPHSRLKYRPAASAYRISKAG